MSTTIYKTTDKGGRRAICILPTDEQGALETIKRVAHRSAESYRSVDNQVIINFPQGFTATYSAERNNDYLCAQQPL